MELGSFYQFSFSQGHKLRSVVVHEQTLMSDFYFIVQTVMELHEAKWFKSLQDYNDSSYKGKRVFEVFDKLNSKVEINTPISNPKDNLISTVSTIVVFKEKSKITNFILTPACVDCEVTNLREALAKVNEINDSLNEWNLNFFNLLCERFTKKEIANLAKSLGIKISTSLKKEDFAFALEYVILENPEILLDILSHSEMVVFSKLINLDFDYDSFSPKEIKLLEELIFVKENSFLHVVKPFSVATNIALLLHNYIRDACDNSVFKNICLVEECFFGITNLYGAIDIDTAIEFLRKFIFIDYSNEEILSLLVRSIRVQKRINAIRYENKVFLCNTLVSNPKKLLDIIISRTDLDYQKFDYDKIMDASGSEFFHINTHSRDILNFLVSEAFLDYQFVLHSLWANIQNEVGIDKILKLFNKVLKFDSEDSFQDFLNLITGYINSVPKWILKGHTSEDLHNRLLKRKPFNEEAITPTFPSISKNIPFVPQKTQRNDPCPCGSGKKFKNCCGNN